MSSWFEKLKELKDAGQFIQFVVFIFFIAVMCWFAGRFSAPVTIIENEGLIKKVKEVEEYSGGELGDQPSTRTTTTDYFQPVDRPVTTTETVEETATVKKKR